MRKVTVITGARSEYGILRSLMKMLDNHKDIHLDILVTGMHLSPEFGETYREITKDGFKISAKIESLLSTNSKTGIAKSISLGILGITEELDRTKPDFTIVLGDRFEIFAGALAAVHVNSILVHISGGDVASGVFDDYYRHMITKIAQIHFVSTKKSMERVLLMGANPNNVFLTGSLAYDELLHGPSSSREEITQVLGLQTSKKWCLAVYHPTIDEETSLKEFKNLIKALKSTTKEYELQVVLLYPNADPGGRSLISQLQEEEQEDWVICDNLQRETYLGLLKESVFMIGNSSSGIVEAPAVNLPVINIGQRQIGREKGGKIIDTSGEPIELLNVIREIIDNHHSVSDQKLEKKPYGDGHAAPRILNTLLNLTKDRKAYSSEFHDNVALVLKLQKIKYVDFASLNERAITASDLLKSINN
ncbi:MAG: UDP-N-acetylglucosamine 2-epimerase [Promethearchaeota archaeon]